MTAVTARRLAHGLGVTTDLFLDVLEAYTGWPNAPKKAKKQVSSESPGAAQETCVRSAENPSETPQTYSE